MVERETGEHRGVAWIICRPTGRCWCGYVRVPEGHLWYALDYDDPKMSLSVHGGLTFGEMVTKENITRSIGPIGPQEFPVGHWLGWDYAHDSSNSNTSKKTVIADCQNAIDQLLAVPELTEAL